jgi:hypothetical protein
MKISGFSVSRSRLTRVWPMKAPDITTFTNKSFEYKLKREHKTRCLEILILDIPYAAYGMLWHTVCLNNNLL